MSQRKQAIENRCNEVLPRNSFMDTLQISKSDEKPPSYETMYPAGLNQGPSTEQLRTAVVLQPNELPMFLRVNRGSEKEERNKENRGKAIESGMERGMNNCKNTGQVKNENKGSFLEHKLTFSEFSKSTKEKIMNQATGLKETAASALSEFCQTTTAHGFSHIIKPNLHFFFKAFWMIITFVCLCLLGTMAYQETLDAFFIRSPTTEINYRDNRASGLILPHMTVCSLAGFLKSKLEEYNVSSTLASYVLISVRGPTIISTSLATNPRLFLDLKSQLTEYLAQNNVTLSELIIKLSPKCEEVIGFCYAADKMYPNKVLLDQISPELSFEESMKKIEMAIQLDVKIYTISMCCKQFFSTVITSSGVCFTTIGGNGTNIIQVLSGINGGLKIVFPINEQEYMDYNSNVVFTTWLSEEGVQVSLSDYSMTASTSVTMNSVRIAPNMAATVALTLDTVDHTDRYASVWPWPNNEPMCLSREAYLQKTEEEIAHTENNVYTTLKNRNCSLVFSNCTAIPSRFQNDSTAECTPHDILEQYFNGSLQECVSRKVQEYDIRGKMFCTTNTYTQQLSYTTLGSKSVAKLQSSGLIPTSSLSMVTIFYSQLQYNELLERTPDFMTWFSNLGGQMGLFLGASFITLVELMFVVLYLIRVSIFRAIKILYFKTKRLLSAEIANQQKCGAKAPLDE